MERPIAVVIDLGGVKDGGGWAAVLCVLAPVDPILAEEGSNNQIPKKEKAEVSFPISALAPLTRCCCDQYYLATNTQPSQQLSLASNKGVFRHQIFVLE